MSISKLAQRVIHAYAHDPEGLTAEECHYLGLNEAQSATLRLALSKGKWGTVTPQERKDLAAAGFDPAFIEQIAGPDGQLAVQERATWLCDHAFTKWWRVDFEERTRAEFIRELGDMPMAACARPTISAALDGGAFMQRAAIKAFTSLYSEATGFEIILLDHEDPFEMECPPWEYPPK